MVKESMESMLINDHERTAREMIYREGDLINHRLTWMWTLHGLLATAVAIFWEKNEPVPVIVLCLMGLLASISFGYSLHCSHRAIHRLHGYWIKVIGPELGPDHPPFVGLEPSKVKLDFLQPWRFLPPAMGVMWVALIILRVLIL